MNDEPTKEPIDTAFLAWLLQNGVQFSNISTVFVENGWRGVIATTEISPGACILSVPSALLISCDSARRDAHLSTCFQRCSFPLSPTQMLAVHLLNELSKGADSFWHLYLRSLPSSYATAACFSFSPAETAALQVPYAVRRVEQASADALESWRQASPVLRELDLPAKWRSKAAWVWALSTISSRTMFMPGDAQAGCLMPLGDLHNYAPPPPPVSPQLDPGNGTTIKACCGDEDGGEGMWGDGKLDEDGIIEEDEKYYRIFARRRYVAGEEVFLCYGRHSNLDLLEFYGFVLENNPHDVALLPPEMLPQAVASQLEEQQIVVHADGNPSWELLRALRLAAMSPSQRKAKAYLAVQDSKVDGASERRALEALRTACMDALQALPSTLEQDEEELGGLPAAGGCLAVAVAWRQNYKRILKRSMELCGAALKEICIAHTGAAPSVQQHPQLRVGRVLLGRRRPAVAVQK